MFGICKYMNTNKSNAKYLNKINNQNEISGITIKISKVQHIVLLFIIFIYLSGRVYCIQKFSPFFSNG